MPTIQDGTDLWALFNEDDSDTLYVSVDPSGDPDRVGTNFNEYFTLDALDHLTEDSIPESIWVKGAVGQIVALTQLSTKDNNYGIEGR